MGLRARRRSYSIRQSSFGGVATEYCTTQTSPSSANRRPARRRVHRLREELVNACRVLMDSRTVHRDATRTPAEIFRAAVLFISAGSRWGSLASRAEVGLPPPDSSSRWINFSRYCKVHLTPIPTHACRLSYSLPSSTLNQVRRRVRRPTSRKLTAASRNRDGASSRSHHHRGFARASHPPDESTESDAQAFLARSARRKPARANEVAFTQRASRSRSMSKSNGPPSSPASRVPSLRASRCV